MKLSITPNSSHHNDLERAPTAAYCRKTILLLDSDVEMVNGGSIDYVCVSKKIVVR
jgi:hypothetical protein